MAVNNQGPSGMASAATALKGILNETVGPMAALTAGAMAFVKYTAGAALNAEKMAAALRASADAKRLEGQFKLIMGSADMARKKVAELSREAAKSPFSFQALGKAALNLQVLSQGAFASSRALKQVQDVAVATGTPVDAVAAAMGDLVGSLKRGGDGAGQAASQLASMGAITQQTAQKVADLASKGAPMGEAMRLVEAETSKASGAAAELANTIDGLQQKMENLQTASDAKIGSMFEEGEKAGKRAAIAWQTFTNAVQEAAAAPWASLVEGWNSVKEAAGNALAGMVTTNSEQTIKVALKATGLQDAEQLRKALDETGNDRTIKVALQATGLENVDQLRGALDGAAQPAKGLSTAMSVIYSVAGAVFLKLAKDALGFAGTLMQLVGGWRAVGTASKGAIVTMARWVGLASAGQVAGMALAAGFIYVAQQALAAAQAIAALNAELEKQTDTSYENQGKLAGKVAGVQTTDDRKSALQDIDAEIEQKNKEIRDKKAAAAVAREKSDNLNSGWNRWTTLKSTRDQAVNEAEAADASVGISEVDLSNLRMARARIANKGGLGMGSEQYQQASERMSMERQIREDAYASAQAAASPQAAAKMAAAQRASAEARLKKAEAAAKVNPQEREALDQATAKLAPDEKNAKTLQSGIEAIKNAPATTESSKLSRDIAVRNTLVDQNKQIEEEAGRARTVAERQAVEERKKVINEQITALGGGSFEKGQKEISGARIQELQLQREAAVKEENLNARTGDAETARNQSQSANVAAAAEQSALQTKQRRADLEQQLAGISDDGANAEAKAVAQGKSKTDELKKALEAAQALEQAQEKYAAAQADVMANPNDQAAKDAADNARSGVEQAQVAAAAAGAGQSSSAELQKSLNLEIQITAANVQQARIQEAAAAARLKAAQRQLNTDRMMTQLKFEEAKAAVEGRTTTGGSDTEASIKSKAIDAEIAANDRALAAAKAKDAAEKAAAANPNESTQAALEEANRKAAAEGVTTADIPRLEQTGKELRDKKASNEAEIIAGAQNEADRMRIATLRAQEAYGTNATEAKKAADKMEDDMAKRARAAELRQTIKDKPMAEQLASLQVDQERVLKNLSEMGTPRMSEMASVGGSAGWAGLVNDPTAALKDLARIAAAQKTALDTVNTNMTTALDLTRQQIAKANEEN